MFKDGGLEPLKDLGDLNLDDIMMNDLENE